MRKSILIAAMLALHAGSLLGQLKVGPADGLKAAVNKPQPVYSPIARQMKVAGKVEVEALVDTNGNVESVKALTGNPMLTQSAVTAVEKWKFTPFTEEGKATKAVVSLSFDFRP